MASNGWIATSGLKDGGTGADQLQLVNAQIADATITAAKLATGAGNAGYYGEANSEYGEVRYG